MFHFRLMLPELIILSMTCLILLVGLFSRKNLTYLLTQLTLILSATVTLLLYSQPAEVSFNGLFIYDGVSHLLKISICISSLFVFLYSRDYIRQRNMPESEFYLLGLFSILGMMVLASAQSFLTLYLGMELMSLPLYAMVALLRDEEKPTEAAMKYFILGAIASGFILYGMSMIYGASQSLNLSVVAQVVSTLPADQSYILIVGLVFVIAGIAFKLGAVPFHMWIPDVYSGAPAAVTLFISVGPKVASFALLVRLLIDGMPGLYVQWQDLMISLSLLSMLLGNIVAIAQTDLRRMFAYSSIAHVGYMLLGLAAASSEGFAAAMFYTIFYAIMVMGGFGIMTLMARKGIDISSINDLRGLNKRNPWLAFIMLLLLFSMAGIPPTVGFFAKLGVLEAAVNAHLVWLACIAIILAVIGSYYYLRVVKVMYFDEPITVEPVLLPFDSHVAISINGLAIIVLGFLPSSIIDLARAAFIG